MNNRIKELANKADIFSYTDYYDSAPVSIVNNSEQVQKFAELIIGECTETVRQVLREEGSTLSYHDASEIQRRIKEYFGTK